MAFEKFTDTSRRGRKSPFSKLKVGEYWITTDDWYPKVYGQLRYQVEKKDREFETLKCVNGIVIKRVK